MNILLINLYINTSTMGQAIQVFLPSFDSSKQIWSFWGHSGCLELPLSVWDRRGISWWFVSPSEKSGCHFDHPKIWIEKKVQMHF